MCTNQLIQTTVFVVPTVPQPRNLPQDPIRLVLQMQTTRHLCSLRRLVQAIRPFGTNHIHSEFIVSFTVGYTLNVHIDG